jgi:hypothetical protein
MGMITTNATVSSQKFTLMHSGEAREKSRGCKTLAKRVECIVLVRCGANIIKIC